MSLWDWGWPAFPTPRLQFSAAEEVNSPWKNATAPESFLGRGDEAQTSSETEAMPESPHVGYFQNRLSGDGFFQGFGRWLGGASGWRAVEAAVFAELVAQRAEAHPDHFGRVGAVVAAPFQRREDELLLDFPKGGNRGRRTGIRDEGRKWALARFEGGRGHRVTRFGQG